MMKNYFLILFSIGFLYCQVGRSDNIEYQENKIDSVAQIIVNSTSDTTLVRAYVDLSDLLYFSNFDTVVVLCEKALRIIETNIIKKNLSKGEKISYLSTYAAALNNIGFIYDDKGDINHALEYYHKSLKIREKLGDGNGVAETLNNIGVIHVNQGNFDLALGYYQKSLKIKERIGNKKSIATSLNNIGGIYRKKGDYAYALQYYSKALKIREEIKDMVGVASSFGNIGAVFKASNVLDSALYFYQKSLVIRDQLGDKRGLAIIYTNISEVEIDNKNILKAKKHALLGYKISKELGYVEGISTSAKFLSEIFQFEKKWDKAFEMLNTHVAMKDSIRSKDTELNSFKEQTKYAIEEIAMKNEILAKQKDLQVLKSNRNKLILSFVIAALILAIIVVVFVYRSYRKQILINDLLNKQKDFAEKQNSEKQIMLKEIHHRVKNSLQVVSSLIRLQSHEVEDAKINQMFEETQNRVLSIAQLHEQMYKSDNLKEIDVEKHIVPLVKDLIRDYQIKAKIILNLNIKNIKLGSSTLIPLGLIVTELISNALKYGFNNAEQGTIILIMNHLASDKYELIIGDDGVGMPKDINFEDTKTLGMQLICTFVEQLNGTIIMLKEPGTMFRIVFESIDD